MSVGRCHRLARLAPRAPPQITQIRNVGSVSNSHTTNQVTGQGHVSPYGRIPFFEQRGPGVGIDLSLQERLDELFAKDPRLNQRIDIGFLKETTNSRASGRGSSDWKKKNRANREMEKAARLGTLEVDLSKVREEWIGSGEAFTDLFNAAELYGIYEDLFKHGYFQPCLMLDIAYRGEDDMVTPVYRGNIVKPSEALEAPEVSWTASDESLWCLVMTGLDTHLHQEGKEYIHWMVGNIRGGDISTGDEVVSYLPPFPPYGTGYHRHAFVMYRQDQAIDLEPFRLKPEHNTLLKERTFSSLDFYSKLQDEITPAGLAFFQSDYDSSLRHFFHNVLEMKEPRYEYEFPEPYIKSWFNFYGPTKKDVGFDEYLDRHRDPKEIEMEVLEKKLKHTHPFHGDTNAYIKYPGAHENELNEDFPSPAGRKKLNTKQSKKIPQWRRNKITIERLKEGYFSTTDHVELRRDPKWNS